MRRSYIFTIVAVSLLVGATLFTIFLLKRDKVLTVAFLDVGQGDAIFIESPEGVQVLIDGGPDSSVVRELSSVLPLYDRTIDMLVISNPDEDHTRGFLDVLARFTVSYVLEPGTHKDTVVYKELEQSIKEEGATRMFPKRGDTIDLGGEAYLEILFPDRDAGGLEPNTGSLVARLVYGETEVFLSGDAPASVEKYLAMLDGEKLKSDILKAGHHGSRTSTSEELLSAVMPSVAVISSGKNSRYGHPHKEVIERLLDFGIETHITAKEGTVVYVSDGITLRRK
ncbi:MAG TPA: MBL fold metallo-hydrolase [Candidatus Paceibacterota bacterium]